MFRALNVMMLGIILLSGCLGQGGQSLANQGSAVANVQAASSGPGQTTSTSNPQASETYAATEASLPPQATLNPEDPAYLKCVADGGQDKLVGGPDALALCLFPDGSVCEEWAYYNGSCAKGACMRGCEYVGSRSEGWYDCNGRLLFWDRCGNETAQSAGSC